MGFLCLGPAAKYEVTGEEVANLKLDRNNLQLELNAANRRLAETEKSEAALSEKLTKLQQENRALKLEKIHSIPAPSSVPDSTPDQKAELAAAAARADSLVQENEQLKANVSKIQTDLQEYETHTAEVLQNVLNEKRDLARQLKIKAEECASLQQQCDQLKSVQQQRDQLQAQVTALEGTHTTQLHELRQSLDAAQAINESTASSTSKLISDYSALQARHNQAQNELKLKDDMLGLLQQQLSEIADDAEESKLKNASDVSLFRNLTMPSMAGMGGQNGGTSLAMH